MCEKCGVDDQKLAIAKKNQEAVDKKVKEEEKKQ